MKTLGLRVKQHAPRLAYMRQPIAEQPIAERIRGRALQTIRRQAFNERPLCVKCDEAGITRIATELDHIVAIINGGKDVPSNRQPLCKECHRVKTREDMRIRWPENLSQEASQRRMPLNIPKSRIPVTIVCGPPGSGKSTYVKEHATPDDVVIDLDAIQQEMSGLPEHHTGIKWLVPALDERNRRLKALATDTEHTKAWFVIGAAKPEDRAKWASILGAKIKLLDIPLDECINRIKADKTRQGMEQRMINAAAEWWRLNTRLNSTVTY